MCVYACVCGWRVMGAYVCECELVGMHVQTGGCMYECVGKTESVCT